MSEYELMVHWEECPLPPDANCELCYEYAEKYIWKGIR